LFAAACGSSEPKREATSAPVRVTIAAAAEEQVAETFGAGGVVRPRLRATLSSRIVAPVDRVTVIAGTRVKAGEPLVILDARQIVSEASRASAMVDSSRRAAEAAAADGQSAAAALVLARKTHERMAALNASRSATQQELDEATAALAAAEARVTAASARAIEADRAVAATTDAAQAAKVVSSYATLTAPFDGIVTSRSVDPGVLATPGTPLLQVETDDLFSLETTVDESWAGRLAIDAPVDVVIDTIGPAALDGRVEEIERAIDPASHAITVKILLPKTPALRSGMFGTAHLQGASRRSVVVPASAVVTRGQLSFVYVADKGTARLRLVRTAPAPSNRIAIVSGLSAGESYITAPAADLQDGQAIAAAGQASTR
jgi:RND family efflux transporter MFP subunit